MSQSYSPSYVSEELFHFVGFRAPSNHEANYEILTRILKSRLLRHSSYRPDDSGIRMSINWHADVAAGELVVPEVICFCDIPPESLQIHYGKYGHVGLGFPRSKLAQRGARPVIYYPMRPQDYRSGWGSVHGVLTVEDWKAAYDGFHEHVIAPSGGGTRMRTLGRKPVDAEEAIHAVNDMVTKDFLAFLKAFDCDLPDDEPRNYYMEREWRMLGHYSFVLNDVSSIFVPSALVSGFAKDFPDLLGVIRISDR